MKPVPFRPRLEALEGRCLLSAATPPRLIHLTASHDWGDTTVSGSLLAPMEVHISHLASRASSDYYSFGFIPGSDYTPPPQKLAPTLADGTTDPAALRTQLQKLEQKLQTLLTKYADEAALAARRFKYDTYHFSVKTQYRYYKNASVAAAREKAVRDQLRAVQNVLRKSNDKLAPATLAMIGRATNGIKTIKTSLDNAGAFAAQQRRQGADVYDQGEADAIEAAWAAFLKENEQGLARLLDAVAAANPTGGH
jgi:hypothetical protein